jgi:metallo-beta-lactamase family protein
MCLDHNQGADVTTLSFYGAAGTVTGSCSLLEAGAHTCLIDCGLFQGNKTVRALNDKPFPFSAKSPDFLLLTHAHTDHTGLVPKLIKQGFEGPIYATQATIDLLTFMLPDSARIQESDTKRSNRWRERRNKAPVEPLYTEADAQEALSRMRPVSYGDWIEPAPGFHARYWNAGHILGSASIEVKFEEEGSGNTMRLLFSGDLGPDEKVFHPEPGGEKGFDYIICESTYGDRERDDYTLEGRREALRKELVAGLERGGNIVIPSFAVERSQELLHDIGVLLANGDIPKATVFLDSPLASKVTDVFVKHAAHLEDVSVPNDVLFRDPNFRITRSVDDSKAINTIKSGAIIISASGMADAGRVLHHLKNNIWRKECTVLFVGYQSPGTLGSIIRSGKSDVRIHGKEFKVSAAIRSIGNYSAHADQSELIDWIMERTPLAGGLFLNHGDDDARAELRRLLDERGIDAGTIMLPDFDETFDLTADTPKSKGRAAARIEPEALERDWYNDYAAFVLALGNAMEDDSNDGKRRAILAALTDTLSKS